MTVDELIGRLTEMPGYREVVVRTDEVIDVQDAGTCVVLRLGGEG